MDLVVDAERSMTSEGFGVDSDPLHPLCLRRGAGSHGWGPFRDVANVWSAPRGRPPDISSPRVRPPDVSSPNPSSVSSTISPHQMDDKARKSSRLERLPQQVFVRQTGGVFPVFPRGVPEGCSRCSRGVFPVFPLVLTEGRMNTGDGTNKAVSKLLPSREFNNPRLERALAVMAAGPAACPNTAEL
ncbi:unnamed protein product [Gadus morhua 'NCC']